MKYGCLLHNVQKVLKKILQSLAKYSTKAKKKKKLHKKAQAKSAMHITSETLKNVLQ